MEENEINLIIKCKKGDSSAFGEIYDLYIKKIYSFIFFKTHHKETAEDLTGLVFTKALENIAKIDEQKGGVSAWLYTIARNTVIDHYRTQKKDYNIDDVWDLSDDANPDLDIDLKDKISEIKKYLSNLKPLQRDIVIMRVWQEMSYKEISEVIHESEANCRMIFSRTIGKLRTEMPASLFFIFVLESSLKLF